MTLSLSSTKSQICQRIQEVKGRLTEATDESEIDDLREELDELEWELQCVEDEMITIRHNYYP